MNGDGPQDSSLWKALAPLEVALPDGSASRIEQIIGEAVGFITSRRSARAASRGGGLERRSVVRVLSGLASSVRLFRSADGRFCAQVAVGDRLEIYGLRSAGFRDWLIVGFLKDQPEPPSDWAIRRVIGMLEARARFTADIPGGVRPRRA